MESRTTKQEKRPNLEILVSDGVFVFHYFVRFFEPMLVKWAETKIVLQRFKYFTPSYEQQNDLEVK